MPDQPTVLRVIYPESPTVIRVGTVIETGESGGEMTASEILTEIKTVDGTGSGLDADLLDGQHASDFAAASHTHAQSDVTGLVSALAGKASTVHTHAQSDVTGLTAALALLAPLASPALTGSPTSPTASPGDNTTKIATTAFTAAAVAALSSVYQALNAKLTSISGLTLSNDDFLQVKSGAIANRTVAQVKSDLGLTGTNSGDQTITLTGDVTGTGTGSFVTTLANSGVSANTYTNPTLTIDAKGRVTSATNGAATYFPIIASFDGGGSAISTGKLKGFYVAEHSGTIVGWKITVDTGTLTFKVWKIATGTAKPTVANVINTSGVAISTGTHVTSSTVTDFTSTAVTAGDIFAFEVTAVSGATEGSLQLKIQRS